MHAHPLAVEWLVVTLECLRPQSLSKARTVHFDAYHIIRDQLKVPDIDLNVVNTKDAAYLSHNRRTGHLYAVRHENGVDVVRIHIIFFDE